VVNARAAVQTAARELELREFDISETVGDGEALLRLEGCGVCGADYERYEGGMDDSDLFEYPVVVGHEPVGRIEQIGSDASQRWGVKEGDRVAVEPFAPCGVCENCTAGEYTVCDQRFIYGTTSTSVGRGLWGGFAYYMYLRPGTIVHELSPDISIEDAVFFNPLGAGFEWVCQAGDVGAGDSVLIMGPGQRGLSSVIAAIEAGADPIIVSGLPDDGPRLDLAERLGVTHTVDVGNSVLESRVQDLTDGRGVDVVVDTTPGATRPVVDGIRSVRRGGTVVLAGTKGGAEVEGFVSDELVLNNVRLQGTLGTRSWSFDRAIDAIESGAYPLDELHTHTVPIDDLEYALQLQGGEIADESGFHITVVPDA
jgi:threonine dehydrogenase-like Zn-dependent dehydrogenase